jgi:hypothetical protein
MFKKTSLIITVVLASTCFSAMSLAETASLNAKVIRVEPTPSDIYGGCIAKLNKTIKDNATAPLDCPGEWVSFSCDGTFNSKDFAWHKFQLAKDALKGDYVLALQINDAKKQKGGYCFAERVGLTNQHSDTPTQPK